MAQLKVIKNSGGPGSAGTGKAGSRDAQGSLQYGFGEADDRAVAIGTVNVVATSWQQAVNAFRATRTAHKRLQIELYHLEQSFRADELDANNPDHWARANEIGVATARALWPTRQTVVVTQNDNGLLHNHIFVNNVDPVTGLACRDDDMRWTRMMPIHDEVLASLGHQQRASCRPPSTRVWSAPRRPGSTSAKSSGRTSPTSSTRRPRRHGKQPSSARHRSGSSSVDASRSGDSRGAKKGEETWVFKTRVHKRMQTYDAYRYGVDLAEAERRIAAAAALAQQRAAQPAPQPVYNPRAGISDDLAAALDAVKAGQPLPTLTPMPSEPPRTQSVTEPSPVPVAEVPEVDPEVEPMAPAATVDEAPAGPRPTVAEPSPATTPRRKSTAQIAVERWEAEQAQQEADDAQYGT